MILDVYTYQYDEIGNVTKIYKNGLDYQAFTFEGRQLRVYEDSTQRVEYYYNYEGIRYRKEISLYDEVLECFFIDKTIQYYLEDNKVIFEQIVDNEGTQTLFYYYDSSGNNIGFEYTDDDNVSREYLYQLNLQNDVIGIIDINGDEVVSYTYDAYGRLINMVGDCEIGGLNSIGYRSYYYDNETNLYYCNSRYYDAILCRWINSDEPIFVLFAGESLFGSNIFQYCNNNPIMHSDPTGHIAIVDDLTFLGIALVVFAAYVLTQYMSTPQFQQSLRSLCEEIGNALGWIWNKLTLLFLSTAKIVERAVERNVAKAKEVIKKKIHLDYYWIASKVTYSRKGVNRTTYFPCMSVPSSAAAAHVITGGDVFASTQAAAKKLAMSINPGIPIGPEIHGGIGYFYHYHVPGYVGAFNGGGHIFFII